MNLVVVQARMSSKRLAGKALLHIDERPLIYHVVARCKRIIAADRVVLATSVEPDNDVLADYVHSLGVEVFRGDENDVLGRFVDIATMHKADNVLRATGDNPLIDFHAASVLFGEHMRAGSDYTCMTGLPVGAIGDVFSNKALMASAAEADGAGLADHVDLHVLENQDRFAAGRIDVMPSLARYRWTIDYAEDLELMRDFFARVGPSVEALTTPEILQAVAAHDLSEAMQPPAPRVSPENHYTAELVATIEKGRSLTHEEVWR